MSCIYSQATEKVVLGLRALQPEPLTRSVYAAQETAQVGCQRDDTNGQKFDCQAEARQSCFPAPCAAMYPPDQPNHRARHSCKYEVQQQDALQSLTLEL